MAPPVPVVQSVSTRKVLRHPVCTLHPSTARQLAGRPRISLQGAPLVTRHASRSTTAAPCIGRRSSRVLRVHNAARKTLVEGWASPSLTSRPLAGAARWPGEGGAFGSTVWDAPTPAPAVAAESRDWSHVVASDVAKLAVFVSGGGSNFRSIHAAIVDGRVRGEVVVVVTDKPECGGSEYAQSHGIPVVAYPKSTKFAPEGLTPQDLVNTLKAKGVDFVLLAGYLKLLPEELCAAFPRAILNIHPALLPAFGGKGYYGMRVHQAVVRSGARFTGPTVHFVDEKFDNGPIIAQSVVPVFHTDTPEEVQKRVLKEEHKLYPEVVVALCSGRVRWREDGTPYILDEARFEALV